MQWAQIERKKSKHTFFPNPTRQFMCLMQNTTQKKKPKTWFSEANTQQLSGFFPVPKHHFGNYKQRTAGMNKIGIPCDNNKVYLT